ncbi:MAG: hypothetical protein ACLUEQ_11965 [Cloacibacillus evryensis]
MRREKGLRLILFSGLPAGKKIPRGKVASYGQIAMMLQPARVETGRLGDAPLSEGFAVAARRHG